MINVPVYINEISGHNRVFIDANKIAMVFGRDDLKDYIQREVGKGNLVRVKTKKGSAQASEGTSPIEAAYSEGTSNNSMTQPKDSVNSKSSISEELSSDKRYSIDDSAEVSESEAADNQAALERFGTTNQLNVISRFASKSLAGRESGIKTRSKKELNP